MVRAIRVVSLLSVAVLAMAACGQKVAHDAAPGSVDGAATSDAPDPSVARDAGFFAPLNPGESAVLPRQPASLDAAYKAATAVIVAEVLDVRASRLIHDLQFAVVELRTVEVLRGALQPELKGKVLVEFPVTFLPDPIEPILTSMRASMPKDRAVWLLRWQGAPPPASKPGAPKDTTVDRNVYNIVHINSGVFIQGEKGVVAATAQSAAGHGLVQGAQAEGERFAKLSDLVTHARSSR